MGGKLEISLKVVLSLRLFRGFRFLRGRRGDKRDGLQCLTLCDLDGIATVAERIVIVVLKVPELVEVHGGYLATKARTTRVSSVALILKVR
jgi:hypothetical protein